MGRLAILPLVLLTTLGCSSSSVIDRWIVSKGGTVADHRLDRVRGLAAALCEPSDQAKIAVAVLDRGDLCAFSWPGGEIFLSRGLVDAFDDAALSAAIAHEIAHVMNHRNSHAIASLRGSAARRVDEVKADRLGVQLLHSAGMDGDAMAAMLEHVLLQPDLPPPVRDDLRHRVEILRRSSLLD